MTSQEQLFLMETARESKSTTVAVLLALFLGGLGAHHFYLGRWGLGLLYLFFCWTFIPAVVSLIECFFMSSRVREYNRKKIVEIKQYMEAIK